MQVQDILAVKGTRVFTVFPEVTLADLVRQMVEHNIGAMLVCQRDVDLGERMVGIVSERDMLRYVATGECDLKHMTVGEIMTTGLITARPADSAADVMGMMTTHRIRHVPIMNGERLVGLVSIGDLLKAQHDHLVAENEFMREYIQK